LREGWIVQPEHVRESAVLKLKAEVKKEKPPGPKTRQLERHLARTYQILLSRANPGRVRLVRGSGDARIRGVEAPKSAAVNLLRTPKKVLSHLPVILETKGFEHFAPSTQRTQRRKSQS